ncbi:pirin family protein [Streptomyces meridianus]|uniref:Pirin family protein n=1 Tax=Streptomyces meridianus TaxID=2938945 RepID=A0ABT0X6V2_9ACTN|nr:pirin family protein [Streptomyces meridianus]MCM2578070.1 pirin family protein [Streptomyces meridianus]
MIEVRKGSDRYRGADEATGIETRHAFSFSGFYDPDNVRFGSLVACNEERLPAGAGFGLHPHRDVEIVTWVVEGELAHEDSEGHTAVVRPGDVQRLSAGSGVRHVERNAGPDPLVFVQMWLVPEEFGGEPEYEVVRGIADATPYALDRARAVLHVRRLREGETGGLPNASHVHVHVVRGGVRLDGTGLGPGDAARITGCAGLSVQAGEAGAELLVWEMGAGPTAQP